MCCFQREKCIELLKSLPHSEAEYVIERMACWARLELQDKRHISKEVCVCVVNQTHPYAAFLNDMSFLQQHKQLQMLTAQIMVEALKYLQSIQTGEDITHQ